MNAFTRLFRTTIGKKILMAVTGIVMVAYLFVHMLGNLQIFLGRDMVNEYGLFLRNGIDGEMLKILWIVRAILAVSLIVHVWMFISLMVNGESARAVGYKKRTPKGSDPASRTMRWGGIALFLYIGLHLLQHTVGVVGYTAAQPFQPHDVYNNLIVTFQQPWFTGIYIAALLALGMHLYHGTWSVFQTLGFNHPRWNSMLRRGTAGLTALIVLGFMTVPISIQAGVIKPIKGEWHIPDHWRHAVPHESPATAAPQPPATPATESAPISADGTTTNGAAH